MRASVKRPSPTLSKLCEFDLLAAGEERQLFRHLREARKSRARATAIRNRIAVSNLRLVVSVAKRFASPQQSVEDLVSEASILLLRCVERFDADRGTRFSTYATRALTHHFVRLRKRTRRQSMQSLSQMPPHRLPSLPPSEAGADLVQREELRRLEHELTFLPGRERALLAGRFGLGPSERSQTFRELAAAQGLSKEWARVTTAGILDRLRHSLDPELASEGAR